MKLIKRSTTSYKTENKSLQIILILDKNTQNKITNCIHALKPLFSRCTPGGNYSLDSISGCAFLLTPILLCKKAKAWDCRKTSCLGPATNSQSQAFQGLQPRIILTAWRCHQHASRWGLCVSASVPCLNCTKHRICPAVDLCLIFYSPDVDKKKVISTQNFIKIWKQLAVPLLI